MLSGVLRRSDVWDFALRRGLRVRARVSTRLEAADIRSSPDSADLKDSIRQEALSLGFVRCGFTTARPSGHLPIYGSWLSAGFAGQMKYLHDHVAARADPNQVLPGVQTIVSLVAAYDPDEPAAVAESSGIVARYARGRDYHLVLGDRLRLLADFVGRQVAGPVRMRTSVDALPVLERDFAMRAGTGFIGKNTMLITPGVGSYTVLGELLLDLALPPDEPEEPRCGRCRLCLDVCPTGAIVNEYTIDARRCISYLTIELDGAIPLELREPIGTMIFGCDLCQEICPFNASPEPPQIAELRAKPALTAPDLVPLLALAGRRYRRFVRHTALRRVRRRQLLRNVCIALGNIRDRQATAALGQALCDREPLIRGHAAWALGRLREGPARQILSAALATEADPWVREEISLASAS